MASAADNYDSGLLSFIVYQRGRCCRPSQPQPVRQLFPLFVVLSCALLFPPARPRLTSAALGPAEDKGAIASSPVAVSNASQLVVAIRNNGIPSIRLTSNVRMDPGIWPTAVPLVRSTNFTIMGAHWYPILDFAFVEGKVHLQPGVHFMFGQVELRNVRTRSGFELDAFNYSPNATVHYQQTVYYCFSCLPLNALANAVYNFPPAHLGPQDIQRNTSWTRTQAPLAAVYGPDRTIQFVSASTELRAWVVPGATSGGGYVLHAVDTLLVCEDPVDLSTCESSRGIDYCVSNKVEAVAAKDDTWRRLTAAGGSTAETTPAAFSTEVEPMVTAAPAEAAAAAGQGMDRSTGGSGGKNGSDGVGIPGGDQSPSVGVSGGRRSLPAENLGIAVGGAVFGVVVCLAAAAVLQHRHRRRRGSGRCDGEKLSAKAVADDDGGGSIAVKIMMAAEGDSYSVGGVGKGGGGGVTRPAKVTQPRSCGGGGDAAFSATATATTPVASDPPGVPQPPIQASGSAAMATAAAAPEPPALPPGPAAAAEPGGLEAGLGPVGPVTMMTLGESYRPLSSSSSCSSQCLGGDEDGGKGRGWAYPGPVLDAIAIAKDTAEAGGRGGGGKMSVPPVLEERKQLKVVVAGITIELTSAIGTGSFGKVFSGFWQGRPVAVKVLQYDKELCRAVHNEVLLSQTLRHPNVVAALYFAQILPGGKLGLQTSGVGGGARAPAPTGMNEASRAVGAAEAAGAAADLGVAPSTTPSGACGARNTAGRNGNGDDGGGSRREGEGRQRLPAAAKCVTTTIIGGGGAAVAAAAPLPQDRRRHSATASTSLPLSLPAAKDILGWSNGSGCSGGVGGGGGSQTGSAPLSWMRPSDLRLGTTAELAGTTSGNTSGVGPSSDAAVAAASDSGETDANRSCSHPDVLSRWDEQRRHQEHVERTGAKLAGFAGDIVISSNGFVLRAGGGTAADAAASDARNTAAAAAVPVATPGIDGTQPAAAELPPPTTPSTAGPLTETLPMEALWLAAHTQSVDGCNHGFLVMELCEGGSVFAWRSGRWKESQQRPDLSVLLRLALDIAYGMSYIHSLGICHGDLKLSNVLLARAPEVPAHVQAQSQTQRQSPTQHTPQAEIHVQAQTLTKTRGPAPAPALAQTQGRFCSSNRFDKEPNDLLEGWLAKVCDFGLSRVLTDDRTHVSTRPYGTPTHMAPELWTEGHMSQAADVYAFGVTLWELSTGERPYKGLNAGRILHRVLLNGGRPPLPPWLPPSYNRLMTSCWAQSAKDRPTFGDIVRHLEAMLAVLAAGSSR